MANVRITDLTELFSNALSAVDVVPIVDINNNETKKISLSNAIIEIAGGVDAFSANDFVTFTVLNSNLDVVSANVDAVEFRRDANTFYVYNEGSNVIVSANIEPNGNNIYSLGAQDAVFAQAFFGPDSVYIGTLELQQDDSSLRIVDENNNAVILNTSLGNVASNIESITAGVESVEQRRADNTFYQTNTHSVVMEANLVSNAQSNLGSSAERWNVAYADVLNLGSFEIQQTQTSNINITPVTIFSRDKNTFNSAKMIVNIEDLTYGQYQSSEILLVQDKNTVRITEYAIVHTSTNPIATFSADFVGDNAELSVSAYSADNIATVLQFIN